LTSPSDIDAPRPRAARRAAAAALAAVLLVPAAASADGTGGAPGTGGAAAPEPVAPAPRAGTVSVSGRVAVVVRANALLGRVTRLRGAARRRDAGRDAVVQRWDDRRARWRDAARATIARDGTFVARWRPHRAGDARLRTVVRRPAVRSSTSARNRAVAASPELAVTVLRPAPVTWYGPGFFGNTTACGEVLEPDTLGVANRTLPCGTKVALLYHGRRLVVAVIDRGPFANGATYDLTQATAESLGLQGSATVGALPVR
jgi:rare lipoprotein A